MPAEKIPRAQARRLTPVEWAVAVEQYELGYANCSSLAVAFGISRQAMMKGLRKRGAVKAARVPEVVAELHRAFDERDRLRRQWAQEKQREAGALVSALLARMNRAGAAT